MSPLYRRIGAYEVRGEIGGGGMADVYIAEDTRTGQTVALKIPRQDPDVRRAERDGAMLQQYLASRDSRVAQVYETGEDEGTPFIAMEYIPGQDLSERTAVGPLEPAEAVRIAIELCDLLGIAHACTPPMGDRPRRGIVHGDLKPRNIRLEKNGRVRVVDFGIAKALSETRRLTHNDFGSLPYSSPERVDSGAVTTHADLWAVAVVLYEMLTGRQPFHAESPRQLEQMLLQGAQPAPLPNPCPRSLDAILHKAFAPRLEQRYACAADFKRDLENVVASQPTLAEVENPMAEMQSAAVGDKGHEVDATRRTEGGDNGAQSAAAVPEVTRRTWGRGAEPRVPANDATRRTSVAEQPMSSSNGATRRTSTSDETTRRTSAAEIASSQPAVAPEVSAQPPMQAAPATTVTTPPATAATAPDRAARRFSRRDFMRIAKTAGIIAGIALIANEVFVIRAAGDLGSRLPSYGRSDADQVWFQYRRVKSQIRLRVGTWGLNGKVKWWMIGSADELTADYLSQTPTIRENGWKQATALLERAAIISPGDSKVRARLRYCQGQLARIDGEALLERNAANARGRFNEARRAFEEAAKLRRGWPDPYLGLARVNAVALADVEGTEDALSHASQAGYHLGNRETALLADAHRYRAERMLAAVPGLPEEERYLQRIRDDCSRALELYDEVPAYGQVSRSILRVHALLKRLEMRESTLKSTPDLGGRDSLDAAQPTPQPQ